jgi:hypothetical protein
MSKLLGLLAAFVIIFAASQAKAQDEIDYSSWTFVGTDAGSTVSGAGTFVTDEFFDGRVQVTSATGTIYDSQVGSGPFTITGLSFYADADNYLYNMADTSTADFGGISFTTNVTMGGSAVNFNIGLGGDLDPGDPYGYVLNDSYNNPVGYAWSPTIGSVNGEFSVCDPDDTGDNQGSCPVSTPEPPSAAVLAIGMVAVGVVSRRRRVLSPGRALLPFMGTRTISLEMPLKRVWGNCRSC